MRAEVIRPADALTNGREDLQRISQQNREAFEGHELEFQQYETWLGVKAKPMAPVRVLEAR